MRDYVKIAQQYRDQVRRDKKGKRFCKWVRLAAEREFQDQQKARKDKSWPYYYDRWWAADVCGFIEKLPHIEGIWDTPNIRLEPWQIFILCTVFGWRRKTGKKKSRRDPRRFNTVYIEVARKNAKSTLTAGISLYCECCEGEVGPQVKLAATSGKQARIVFEIAHKMVEQTPDLREAFGLKAMAHSIPCFRNGGHIRPINANSCSEEGFNPSLTVIDELHAHKDRSLFDVLKSARGARKNRLSWYITTAGYNLNGVCYEQRTIVTKILEGIFEGDHYFGIIYKLDEAEADEDKDKSDDPYDKKTWIKANPNLGVSVDIEEFRQFASESKESPESEGEYKTKKCNLWLNAANAWLNMFKWDACADSGFKLDQFEGEEAWIGGDLADRRDVAAVVVLFWPAELDMPIWFPFFYLPKENVKELAHKTHTHYKVWADKGLFNLTEGNFINYNKIEEDIRELCNRFVVRELAFDQFGSAQMAGSLVDDGYEAAIIHKNAKNYAEPALELEARIKSGLCRHDGNPVMKWMASNTVVDRRVDGSILPKKESQNSPNKIDGMDALILALGRAMNREDNSSIYDKEEVFAV